MHYRDHFKFRAEAIRDLIKAGHIKTFKDIFRFVEKAGVARKTDIKPRRLLTMIERPEKISIFEIERIMKVIRVDYKSMLILIETQAKQRGSGVPKK